MLCALHFGADEVVGLRGKIITNAYNPPPLAARELRPGDFLRTVARAMTLPDWCT